MPEEIEAPRVRYPRRGEVFGIVSELKGGARMLVQCIDGKTRLCRVPGKIKRQVWVKLGDIVLVEPWSIESDAKGDIVYRYTRLQADYLRRQGILKI